MAVTKPDATIKAAHANVETASLHRVMRVFRNHSTTPWIHACMDPHDSQTYRDAEKSLERFLDAQIAVFQDYGQLRQWCRESLDGVYDQRNYEVSKHVFKDVVAFESEFEEFEIEFWNYVADVDGTRDRIDNRVIKTGLADHKEYFFAKIERCVSRLSEVITEVSAAELGWPFLYDLERSLESLYDITEDLIETDPSQLGNSQINDLLSKVPPQRLAPLEVISTTTVIRRRTDTHLGTKVADTSIRQAIDVLRELLDDTQIELERSNCDPRILKSVGKCLAEIRNDYEAFSPIKFGIYVNIAKSFNDVIMEESSGYLARQVVSTLMQCEVFLRNFYAWSEYSSDSEAAAIGDSSEALQRAITFIQSPVFDPDVSEALEMLAADRSTFSDRGKIDYSIFQSISNAVSEACRQALRFLSTLPRATTSLLGETTRDGAKNTIGVLASAWLITNSEVLLAFARDYPLFGWLAPVIEFFKKIGAQ